MKKKHIFSVIFLAFSMSASAQIQLLYTQTVGRNVIDRNKKLYWMEGEDDPCYDILNYKKAGNKETFTLRNKDKGSDDSYNVVITLNEANVPKEMTISGKYMQKSTSPVSISSGDVDEDNRLYRYFNELAGNPVEQGVKASAASSSSSVPAAANVSDLRPENAAESVADKVKGTAQKAFGKVKGMFGKKKNKD